MPSVIRYLIGSNVAPICKSSYPLQFAAVNVKSTRTIVDPLFPVPKCERLPKVSRITYELFFYDILATVSERTMKTCSRYFWKSSWDTPVGISVISKEKGREDQQRRTKESKENAVDERVKIQRRMMEMKPLLEASGQPNWRSISISHDESPSHCLLQTWWYPVQNNLVLIWDSGELLFMDL